MNMGRIASSFATTQAQALLQVNSQRLNTLQERVSAGKNIIRPSDDPLGTTTLLDLSQSIRNDDQYLKNIQSGLSELESSMGALDNSVDLINRASELATQAATVTNGANNLAAIQNELDLIIDQVVQVANTSLGGRYLFSGVKTQTQPFTRTGDTITYNGTPQTSNYQRQIEVATGSPVSVNLPGDAIFGSVTSAGSPAAVSGGAGIFRTLTALKQNVRDNDRTAIRARMDELTTALTTLTSSQAKLGSMNNRLELTQNRLDGRKSILSQQYARLQDIDLPKLVSDMRYQEQVTQASLGVIGRVISPSLMQYLS